MSERLVEVTERRAHAGDVGELEVQLARIEASRAAQAVAMAAAESTRGVVRLAALLGAGADEEIAVVDVDDERVDPPAGEDELVARALASRPDLAVAREEADRLTGEADVTRREGRVPTPVLRGFYRQEQNEERIAGGAIDLPLPIFNRGQGTEIAQRAAAAGAAAEVGRLTREIPREVRAAFARRASAAASWRRYQRDVLPAVHAARVLLERAFEGGYLGLPDVLAQRDRLLAARGEAIGAWLELAEADADLHEAVGEGGW